MNKNHLALILFNIISIILLIFCIIYIKKLKVEVENLNNIMDSERAVKIDIMANQIQDLYMESIRKESINNTEEYRKQESNYNN